MLNLPMTFNSAFSGSRNIYLDAAETEGANSGWQTRGTWTVPGTALSLTADLVTPNSGSGVSQAFALQYSDTAGASSLSTV